MDNQQVTSMAWLAGILDGEGTIGFNVSKELRKGKGRTQILPWIQVANTSYELIEKCIVTCSLAGIMANTCRAKALTKGNKIVWFFCLAGSKRVGALLPLVIPHLTCKCRNAENVMAFIESRFGKGLKTNAERVYTDRELSLVQATREGSSETTRETPSNRMKI